MGFIEVDLIYILKGCKNFVMLFHAVLNSYMRNMTREMC